MKKLKRLLPRLKMPHTYVILTIIYLTVIGLTYLIPGGEYSRVPDPVSGKMVVLADSFHFTDGKRPGFFDIFLNLQRGYVSAADILFLIIFAYGYVYMLIDNGTLSGLIRCLVRVMGKRTSLIIPVSMMAFGLLGSTMGIYEEVYGMVPVFVGIAVALGYDTVVGGAIVFVGVATGFAAATMNPFSVGIAQSIAGVPMFSGLGFRIFVFVVFQFVSILYVMWYARRVKENPEQSVLFGEPMNVLPVTEKKAGGTGKEEADAPAEGAGSREEGQITGQMTGRHKCCLCLFVLAIGIMLYGTMRLGWYINEIAAMFLMMMILTGLVGGYGATRICRTFITSTKSMTASMLVVGFTRGILLTMQDAMISDTIVYYLAVLLEGHSRYFSAVGMLGIQNLINFFITGSSSQAAITMPIMAPVADLVGISRQTAVLAFQFGDGFSNMFWPTACALECGLMGVPINKWYRFMTPLFGIMAFLQVLFVMASTVVF